MKKSQKKRRSIILRVALLAFSVYFLLSIAGLQRQLIESKKEYNQLKERKSEMTLKINELVNLLENGTESDFIEKAARERLGYVYSDEKVYIDLSGN